METGAKIIMIEDTYEIHRNIITEHGTLTVEVIYASKKIFSLQMFQAQSSVQIFHFLTNFTTEATHLKIVAELSQYMDGENLVGELLFKLMRNKAIIDTCAK